MAPLVTNGYGTIDDAIATAVAEIDALTQANQNKIQALAQYGVQIQHNIPMVILADMVLGTAATGEIPHLPGPTRRLAYERRVQEVLGEQLDQAEAQVMAEIRKQQLLQGVHPQVPTDVAQLIVPGR